MQISAIKKLCRGDQVFWNDPDGGACSRHYTILLIKYMSGVVKLTDIHGDYLECYARELTGKKRDDLA